MTPSATVPATMIQASRAFSAARALRSSVRLE